MVQPARTRYTNTAIVLHWLMALLILGTLVLGWTMSDLPISPTRIRLFNYHKWIGITILMLAAARLVWRIFHRPPPMPSHIPATQRLLAHGAHWLLYALFFLVPLAGWAYSSAAGYPVRYLGLVQLPDFAPRDDELAALLERRHAFLAYTLAAIVALHIVGALKHAFERPRGYLRRMTAIGS